MTSCFDAFILVMNGHTNVCVGKKKKTRKEGKTAQKHRTFWDNFPKNSSTNILAFCKVHRDCFLSTLPRELSDAALSFKMNI